MVCSVLVRSGTLRERLKVSHTAARHASYSALATSMHLGRRTVRRTAAWRSERAVPGSEIAGQSTSALMAGADDGSIDCSLSRVKREKRIN